MAVEQEIQGNDSYSSWHPESPLKENLQLTKNELIKVTAITGIAGFINMINNYAALKGKTPSEDEIKEFKKRMDIHTNGVMEMMLDKSRIRNNVKAGEGKKDGMPDIKGLHGKIDAPKVDLIVDPVDGTSLLANWVNGAVSFAAASNNISDIQAEDYGVFITVPPEAATAVDLKMSVDGHKKVLKDICEALNIQPNELTQTMLRPNNKGRQVNQFFYDAAEALGVQLDLIDAGDVMPSLHASLSRQEVELFCNRNNLDPKVHGKPRIVVGRTAFVEKYGVSNGSIITGGVSVGHKWNQDLAAINLKERFTHKDFAPGDKEQTLIIASFITPSNTFGQEGIIDNNDGTHTIKTLVLTAQNGAEIVTNTFSLKDFIQN